MLTPTSTEALPGPAGNRPATFQCLAAAYPHHPPCSITLSVHDASSARLALRWLKERTSHITDQLDAPHAQPGRHWLTDEAEHERALTYLTTGTAYQLTLYDEHTRYVLVAYPQGPAA
ncbi:hypothetical protein [Streptomyces sp. NPDC006668]|uniref:hypothetical protein n=1 Tax=Streptomyces sp. NPDC006668 TaxID=3156903 RepID=UPI0033FCABD2